MPRNKIGSTTKAGSNEAIVAAAAAKEAEAKAAADKAIADAAAAAAEAAAAAAKATTVAPNAIGGLRGRVDAIVAVLEADENFATETKQYFLAHDIKLRGACSYLSMIEANLSEDQIDSLPIPGSTQKTSQNPDSYTDEIAGIKVRSSYYKDMARKLPGGSDEQAIVNACDQYIKNDPACPDDYKARTRTEINDLRKQADSRITKLASVLRKAVDLRNQMILITETLPNVECDMMTETDEDGNEVLRSGPTPILVRDKLNPMDGEYISADTCLGYRVAFAKTQVKPGNSEYKALKFSGGKQQTGTNNPGAVNGSGMAPHLTNPNKLFEYLMEVVAFLRKPENQRLVIGMFAKQDSEGNVEVYGDAIDELSAQFSGPVEERYKRIKIAKVEAANKASADAATKGATATK
jgi:hypothetical protein